MCLICYCFQYPQKILESAISLLCSCLPVAKPISDKYSGTRRERAGGEENLSESQNAWSTQVADSQETDLIMLPVTILCPYSGWHRCWQRPPPHFNQETKCHRAPQKPCRWIVSQPPPWIRVKTAASTALTYSTVPSGSLLSTPETKVHQGEWVGEKLTQLIDR